MGRSSSRKLALLAILLTASPLLANAGDRQYGIEMFAKAGRGACWVEKVHKLPPINDGGVNFGTCDANMRFETDEWQQQFDLQAGGLKGTGIDINDVRDQLENNAMTNLKNNMKDKFDQLPSVYRSACESFVDNENQKPAKDYSSILQDSSHGDYPFRGLAHCMIGTIEQNNGAPDVAALKSHWLNPKSFLQAIIDRENENRARHGVPALKLDSELNERAQKYANELAQKCKPAHMSDVYGKDYPDLQYNGGRTGENIGGSGSITATDTEIGVDTANDWYSEIENYPWPQYTGNNKKGTIGHFTASVWKSTNLAGYGIARNEACPEYKVYVVSRYSPGGNIRSPGMAYYKDNVLPPL
ncbi:unnamed protein product [Orchesella dallaii]|uniref:SCP domain-containing protein n=1 Tax=Orchesella dallaii TaxID=48710 RepID=A0ABP1PPE2_9HEXA